MSARDDRFLRPFEFQIRKRLRICPHSDPYSTIVSSETADHNTSIQRLKFTAGNGSMEQQLVVDLT